MELWVYLAYEIVSWQKSSQYFFLIGEMSRPANHAIMVHRRLQLAKNREENYH